MKMKMKPKRGSELPKFQALVGAAVADLVNLCRFYDVNDLSDLVNNHADRQTLQCN